MGHPVFLYQAGIFSVQLNHNKRPVDMTRREAVMGCFPSKQLQTSGVTILCSFFRRRKKKTHRPPTYLLIPISTVTSKVWMEFISPLIKFETLRGTKSLKGKNSFSSATCGWKSTLHTSYESLGYPLLNAIWYSGLSPWVAGWQTKMWRVVGRPQLDPKIWSYNTYQLVKCLDFYISR